MSQEAANILLVDDRRENLVALSALLSEEEGYRLLLAESGNEALGILMREPVALVLLDVQMPEMDGYEAAELMRGAERTRHIPIIFVTAISKEQRYEFRGYESGAVDYLFKPIEPAILKAKVRIFAELYHQRRLIERQVTEISAQRDTLERQLKEIETLRGFLPVCCNCRKVRDDGGYWHGVEEYLRAHAGTQFTHGLCPDCAQELYGDLLRPKGE